MNYKYTYEIDTQENLDNKKINIFAFTSEDEKAGQLNGMIKHDKTNRQYYFVLDNIYVYTLHQKQNCGIQMMTLLKNVLLEIERKYDTKIWWITGYLGNKASTYPDWEMSLPFLEKCSKTLFGDYAFELYNAAGQPEFENVEEFLSKALSGHFVIKLADYTNKKYQFCEIGF